MAMATSLSAFFGSVIAIVALMANAANAAPHPLVAAAKSNDAAMVAALLARHVNVDDQDTDGATALLWATYHNDDATVRRLLAAGADVTTSNIYGETPLSTACQNGNA